MSFWILERTEGDSGEVVGVVVRADDEAAARKAAARNTPDFPHEWLDPANSSCEEIPAVGHERVVFERYYDR